MVGPHLICKGAESLLQKCGFGLQTKSAKTSAYLLPSSNTVLNLKDSWAQCSCFLGKEKVWILMLLLDLCSSHMKGKADVLGVRNALSLNRRVPG